MGDPKFRRAKCSACGGDRNCNVVGEHVVKYDDEYFMAETRWSLLECRGCEHVFVEKTGTNSEDFDIAVDDEGEQIMVHIERKSYWPAFSRRKKPEWMTEQGILEIDDVRGLNDVLIELYSALENDMVILAGIGIRTAFDVASELLEIDSEKTFQEKIDSLVQGGMIGAVDRNRISILVDAGSAVAHRGWRPSSEEISTMMDVLEHFLNVSLIEPRRREKLDEKAKVISASVPAKKKRIKKDADLVG